MRLAGYFRAMPVLLALCVGVLAGLALSVASGVHAARRPALTAALPSQDARALAEVLQRVRDGYVDTVDDHRLMRQAAHGLVAGLDEHSTLLEPVEYAQLQAATSGSYAGVGVEVDGIAAGLRVVHCVPGAPAAQAGIHAEDLIVRIGNLAVSAANVDAATALLRGIPGSVVRLAVKRGHPAAALEFQLQRTEVNLPSVAAETLAPGYGYVRIEQFTEATAREVAAALLRLINSSRSGLRGLIVDLRDNPGGVLEAATEVADDFLDQGLIVSAEGRLQEARFRVEATPGDLSAGARIVVLVNGGSASAAEILAAALHQNHRATLLGAKTYGKGTVQTIMPLSTGQALKLTTSRYFTPNGSSIDGVGLVPDVLTEAAQLPPGEPRRDAQVAAALSLLRGGTLASRAVERSRHYR